MNEPRREQRGDPIPGSKYVRDWCDRCGEPIRVKRVTARINICDDCYGVRWAGSPDSRPAAVELPEDDDRSDD